MDSLASQKLDFDVERQPDLPLPGGGEEGGVGVFPHAGQAVPHPVELAAVAVRWEEERVDASHGLAGALAGQNLGGES